VAGAGGVRAERPRRAAVRSGGPAGGPLSSPADKKI